MYQTFVKEGRFKDVMEDIFEAGKRLVRVGAVPRRLEVDEAC
jgi:hypothetical protein